MLRFSPKTVNPPLESTNKSSTETIPNTDNPTAFMKRAVSVGGDLSALENRGVHPLFTTMHKKSGSVGSDLAFMENSVPIIPSKSEPDLRVASATIKDTKPTKTHSRTNSITSEPVLVNFYIF